MYYVIQTPTGFVGRRSLTAPLSRDLPRSLAYTYDTIDAAFRVAEEFEAIVRDADGNLVAENPTCGHCGDWFDSIAEFESHDCSFEDSPDQLTADECEARGFDASMRGLAPDCQSAHESRGLPHMIDCWPCYERMPNQ